MKVGSDNLLKAATCPTIIGSRAEIAQSVEQLIRNQ